jgi:hypothetical protein
VDTERSQGNYLAPTNILGKRGIWEARGALGFLRQGQSLLTLDVITYFRPTYHCVSFNEGAFFSFVLGRWKSGTCIRESIVRCLVR